MRGLFLIVFIVQNLLTPWWAAPVHAAPHTISKHLKAVVSTTGIPQIENIAVEIEELEEDENDNSGFAFYPSHASAPFRFGQHLPDALLKPVVLPAKHTIPLAPVPLYLWVQNFRI